MVWTHRTGVVWSSQLLFLHSTQFPQPKQRVMGPKIEPHLQHHLLPAPIRPSGGQVDPLESRRYQAPFQTCHPWPAMVISIMVQAPFVSIC